MRSPRFLAAAAAVGLTVTLASAPMSADAQVDTQVAPRTTVAAVDAAAPAAAASGQRVVRPTAGSGAAARAEGDVTITSKISYRKKPHEPYKLYLRGKVTGSGGPVAIQRATACNATVTYCNFKFYRKVWVRDDGVFDGQISAPKTLRGWVWRARVEDVNGADWWQTCTKTKQQECKIPTPANS